jgi:O-antigen ligase
MRTKWILLAVVALFIVLGYRVSMPVLVGLTLGVGVLVGVMIGFGRAFRRIDADYARFRDGESRKVPHHH